MSIIAVFSTPDHHHSEKEIPFAEIDQYKKEIKMNYYLYSMRIRRRLTQSNLARQAGISRTTLWMLEQKGGHPSRRVGAALCRILQCDYGEVFPDDLSLL